MWLEEQQIPCSEDLEPCSSSLVMFLVWNCHNFLFLPVSSGSQICPIWMFLEIKKKQKIRLQINLSILLYTFFNSLEDNYEVLPKVLFIYSSIIYLPQCLSSVLRLEVFSKKLFLCLYTRSKNCFSCCLMGWQSAAMLKLQYSFVILSEMP